MAIAAKGGRTMTREDLQYEIEGEVDELAKLGEITFEQLREFDRCLDHLPGYLTTAAIELANTARDYRQLIASLHEHFYQLQNGAFTAEDDPEI
jgi:hypothetical protein